MSYILQKRNYQTKEFEPRHSLIVVNGRVIKRQFFLFDFSIRHNLCSLNK